MSSKDSHDRTPGGLSIRYSLPLLISAIAIALMALYTAAAYRQLRSAEIAVAGERLTGITQQLASMMSSAVPNTRELATQLGRNDTIVTYMRDPASADPAPVLALFGTPSGQALGVELRDAAGRRLLANAPDLPGGDVADSALAALGARALSTDSALIGPIRALGGELISPIVAPVVADGETLGWVVAWQRLAASNTTQIEQLVGSSADIFLVNRDGSLWSDLLAPVAAAPLPPDSLTTVAEYERPGEGWRLGVAVPVAGTEWAAVTEMPRDTVIAGARATLRWFAWFGVFVTLAAVAVTWYLAGRFTAPIMEVAGAANAFSAGEYSRRSRVTRSDEVGTLSRAFNTMAERVGSAHAALEQKVDQLAHMERKNREVGERLGHVLASSPNVTYQRLADDLAAPFTWVSENVERLLGYTAADVMAPGWWAAHVHADDDARPTPRSLFSESGEAMRDWRLRHRDGRYRWIRDRQRLDGEYVVGSWTDVTELRSLEEQFRQAQKLEAVGRLAGGIAHDFNNIVTVILGETEMALSRATDPALRESIDQVRTAAHRASLLTRQLLTFSRKHLAEPTVFNLNDVVRDVQEMLRRLISADVDLQFRMEEQLGGVYADRAQVEQVLMNLVINARDALPDGGTILIQTHEITLDEDYARSHPDTTPGDYVALVVSDNGTGMSREVLDHIFEPFFTTKGPTKGTGLGLATSYGIARQFGGHIGVYSEVDVGTTMKLYLPRSEETEQTPAEKVQAEAPARGTETVLLVEDDSQVRAIVARMLIAQGYAVLQAANGDDALRVLQTGTQHIDLLLTDLVMPRMSGRELAERACTLRPSLRVLFTSGYTEDIIFQNRLLERDVMLLHKPFTRGALATKVRAALDAPLAPK